MVIENIASEDPSSTEVITISDAAMIMQHARQYFLMSNGELLLSVHSPDFIVLNEDYASKTSHVLVTSPVNGNRYIYFIPDEYVMPIGKMFYECDDSALKPLIIDLIKNHDLAVTDKEPLNLYMIQIPYGNVFASFGIILFAIDDSQ